MTSTPARLLLVRHAKAANPDDVDDHARPLAPRGERDAPEAGRWLAEQGWVPDHVVCSDALRARSTAELLVRGLVDAGATAPAVEPLPDLYEASVHQVLQLVTSSPVDIGTLLVVGHEPTVSETVAVLVGRQVDFPTCTIAQVELDGGWESAAEHAGRLVGVHTPRA